MSSGRTQHESSEPASARSPFSERVVEKLDSFRGLFRASVSGAQVPDLFHLPSSSRRIHFTPDLPPPPPPPPCAPGEICPEITGPSFTLTQTETSVHSQQTAAHEAALHRHSVPSSLPSSELRRLARDIHAAKEGGKDSVSAASAPLSRASTGERSFFGIHGAKYSHGPLNQMRGAVRGSLEMGPGEGEAEHQSWWPLGSSQDRHRSIAVDGMEVSPRVGDRHVAHGPCISTASPRDDGDDDGLAGSPRTKDLDTFAQAFLVQNNID